MYLHMALECKMPVKRGKGGKTESVVVFTEISFEPLPGYLEIDYKGEAAAIEMIDVCVYGAVDLVLTKEKAEMAVRFSVVSMAQNYWFAMSMVPPLLTRDFAMLVDKEDPLEPDPGAIDSWAALHISTIVPRDKTSTEDLGSGRTSLNLGSHDPEHRGSSLNTSGLRSGESFSTLPRSTTAQFDTEGGGRRSMSRGRHV